MIDATEGGFVKLACGEVEVKFNVNFGRVAIGTLAEIVEPRDIVSLICEGDRVAFEECSGTSGTGVLVPIGDSNGVFMLSDTTEIPLIDEAGTSLAKVDFGAAKEVLKLPSVGTPYPAVVLMPIDNGFEAPPVRIV